MNPSENATIDVIKARRSVRQYSDTPVPHELIMKVLEAANCAPSAHNSQSWRFIVLRGTKKDELAKLVSNKAESFTRPTSVLLRMSAKSIYSAPVVIAVANTSELVRHGTETFKVDKEVGRDFFRTMEIQNSAAAVENMLIAATALGISSVWLGILFLIKHDVLEFMGESDGEFMAVVPMGYAVRENCNPSKRNVQEVTRFLD
ncbi:MAG: nitroreductase [Lentisphaerae bacterium GWF2_52_8]|nr:MAG: nitroreductase [Lentisphaerae bacterium GWF2_52_8]